MERPLTRRENHKLTRRDSSWKLALQLSFTVVILRLKKAEAMKTIESDEGCIDKRKNEGS